MVNLKGATYTTSPLSIEKLETSAMIKSTIVTMLIVFSGCTRTPANANLKASEEKPVDISAFKEKLGLENFPCGNNITISVAPKKQCGLGDGDAIIQDIGKDLSRRIILRLESFKDWNRGAVGALSVNSLQMKAPQEVTLKANEAPVGKYELLGLFICADEQGTGICGNKHLVDPTTLNFAASISASSERAKTDKIYFFKLIMKEDDTCYFSNRRDGGFLNDSVEEYRKLLASRSTPHLSKMLDFALRYEKTLTNYPLVKSNGKVAVLMPFEDKGAVCDF